MAQFGRMFYVLLAVLPRVFGQAGSAPADSGKAAPELRMKANQRFDGKLPGMPEPLIAAASGMAANYGDMGGNYGGNGYDDTSNYQTGYQGAGYTGGCYGRPAGMYGDASYDCKSYKVCQADGRLDTLYCPPYTRFNNYMGICDWHFKVDGACNPLYKEEYSNNNNYGGGNSYNNDRGSSYSAPVSGGYANALPVSNAYQAAPYQGNRDNGNNYGSGTLYGGTGRNTYGNDNYQINSNNYGSGGDNYNNNAGYRASASGESATSLRPPVYNLMSFGTNTHSSFG